jgi:DNA-binding Lrp family transcriptional regulator
MNRPTDDAVARLVASLAEGLPIGARPYDALAQALGVSEADVLAALRDLRASHVIRRIGADFDAARLGYHATLGAVAVGEENVEAAAEAIGALPNITHIFEVEDRYRVWFAVVVPALTQLEAVESEVRARTGSRDVFRALPAEVVKVTGSFDADGAPDPAGPGRTAEAVVELTRDEQALVRLLQGDLSLAERPFAELTATLAQCGFDVDERWAIERAEHLAEVGALRGIRGTVRMRSEPWRLAVVVWPPVAAPDAPASLVAGFPEVLHVLERRAFGGGASIMSVLEAPDRAALERSVERIRSACGLEDPRVLYPVREFKRAQMKYFTDGG